MNSCLPLWNSMTIRRVGLWLIGACGGVGATAALGLAALRRGVSDSTSLVTALPLFERLSLDEPAQFVVGGHEIRRAGFRDTVRELQKRSNIFEPALADACQEDLEEWEANLRPGTLLNSGPDHFAPRRPKRSAPLRHRPRRHRTDSERLCEFRERNKLEQVVVVNVSSTEHLSRSAKYTNPWSDWRRPWSGGRRRCRRRRCTPGPHSISACRISTSRPRSVRRSRQLWNWPSNASRHRRQGRQDRRNASENRAGADVRPSQSAACSAGSATISSATATARSSTIRPTRPRKSAPRTR